MDLFRFIPTYQEAIYQTGREPAFVMLSSFILAYICARGYTRLARKHRWGSANIAGVHAHHMVFGLIVSFTASAIMFSFLPPQGLFLLILAFLFGSGAALVLDEFALFFHLKDVYWTHEGRKSVDAVVLGVAIGTLLLIRVTPLGIKTTDASWLIAITVSANLVFALVAALKGKIFFALFGIFIPTLTQIGAIRLAEPDSIWAHKFYYDEPEKLAKARRRYDGYEKRWRVRKEQAWDFIGGKPDLPAPRRTRRTRRKKT